MCGIFGEISKTRVNLPKNKVLGLYNITRGRDSCGYYYDGLLRHGIDKAKEWDDFITDGMLIKQPKSKGGKVFIGHTRAATKGAKTLENAHPFRVENLIQVHNGTIENAFDLCDKYEIDHSLIFVDSLALAHLIKKVGWQVLDEYVGYAACMWHFEDEPDALYVYHGASRVKEDDKTEYCERPLMYMETSTGTYFSSLASSLMAIRDKETELPQVLPHNIVYKFVNGKLDSKVYTVNRADANMEWLHPKKKKPQPQPPRAIPLHCGNRQTSLFNDAPVAVSLIWREQEPAYIGTCLNRVFFYMGRYHRKMEGERKSVFTCLLNGRVEVSKAGYIITNTSSKKMRRGVKAYYFVDGVMLKDEKAYRQVVVQTDVPGNPLSHEQRIKKNFAYFISKFAAHPVTCYTGEGMETLDDQRFRWYLDGNLYEDTFYPTFSQRGYTCIKGRLTGVKRDPNDIVFIKPAQQQQQTTVQQTKGPAAVVNFTLDDDLDPKEVKTIMDYFHMAWLDLSEVDSLPLPVYAAIEEYLDDFLYQIEKKELDDRAKLELYNEFIKDAVKDRKSFFETMHKELQCNLQYYVEAGINDIKERQEKEEALKKYASGFATCSPDISTTLINKEGDFADTEFGETDEDAVNEADKFVDELNNELVKKQWEQLIDQMVAIRKTADACQAMDENNDLAQGIAYVGYNTIDLFKAMANDQIKDKQLLRRMAFIDVPFM